MLQQLLACGIGLALAAALPQQPSPTFTDPDSILAIEMPADAGIASTLTWTADVQSWQGGGWNGGVTAAANYAGEGYTDWRLPTPAELQAALQIPAGQPGSWGMDLIHMGGTGTGWTSRSAGNYAYAVTIAEDATGAVSPGAPTGTLKKYLKGSNFSRTKFVRP